MPLPKQSFQEYYSDKLDQTIEEDLNEFKRPKKKGIFKKILAWTSWVIATLSYLCAMLGIFTVGTLGLESDDFMYISIFFVLGFIFEYYAGKYLDPRSLVLKLANIIILGVTTFLTFLIIIDIPLNGFVFNIPIILAKIAYIAIDIGLFRRFVKYCVKKSY